MEDDLVAGVDRRPQGEVDGLRRADGDEDLAGRVVADAVAALEVVGDRLPQLERAVVARVVGPLGAEARDPGLDDLGRRGEVGLPHPEADDVLHRRRDVEEAPDPRREARRGRARRRARAASGSRGAPEAGVGHVSVLPRARRLARPASGRRDRRRRRARAARRPARGPSAVIPS